MRPHTRQFEVEEEPILGINPLVLAIALIVGTILLAAVLSFWASGIGKKGIEEKNDCTVAEFQLYSGLYDPSKSELSFTLENLQETGLTDMRLYVIYSGENVIEKRLEDNLEVKQTENYNFVGIPKDFEKGVVKTKCPGVSIEFTEQNGTLIEV
ncbi:MAG: hypothetical protein GF368_02865 [Candidatus Aenigmarchaeota archaeon]|nr:hypothetical protein [Candidatus Aenigmarchaeota archaeon]